jgi:nucleotide-binding universal stress UspA family protein
MAEYKVIVVGTDGSDTSLRAVDKAAEIAAESDAKLVIAMAYLPEQGPRSGEPDQPEREGYKTEGDAPVYAMLHDASSRARQAGAREVHERPIPGDAVNALIELVEDVDADLLVVGNLGQHTLTGKLFGSVPSAVNRRAKTEVLVVETTD